MWYTHWLCSWLGRQTWNLPLISLFYWSCSGGCLPSQEKILGVSVQIMNAWLCQTQHTLCIKRTVLFMNWFVKINQWHQFPAKKKKKNSISHEWPAFCANVESIRVHFHGGIPTFTGIDYQVPLKFDFSLIYFGSDNFCYQTKYF